MKIRELREAAGLTRQALALRVGVSRQAVAAWEDGAWPSAELLPRIAFALGCRIGDLYEEAVQNGPREEDGPPETPAPAN